MWLVHYWYNRAVTFSDETLSGENFVGRNYSSSEIFVTKRKIRHFHPPGPPQRGGGLEIPLLRRFVAQITPSNFLQFMFTSGLCYKWMDWSITQSRNYFHPIPIFTPWNMSNNAITLSPWEAPQYLELRIFVSLSLGEQESHRTTYF